MSAFQNSRRPPRILILAPVAVMAGMVTGGVLHRIFPGKVSMSAASATGDESASGGGGNSQNPSSSLPPSFLATFKAAPDQDMRRMLAQALPKADAALMPLIAGHLWDREPIVCPEPVWKAVMARWAQLDAKAASDWVQERDARAAELKAEKGQTDGSDEGKPDWLTGTMLAAWAEQDPDSAWKVCSAEEGSVFSGLGLNTQEEVLQMLAESDPARALKLFRASRMEAEPWSGFEGGTFRLWARSSPREALEFFTKEKPPACGIHDAAAGLALGWASGDPAASAAWITSLSLEDRRELLSSISELSPLTEPETAARLLSLLPADAALHKAGSYVAGAWAGKAPAEALAWIRTRFPEGPSRADALVSVAETVMSKDLRAAVAIMDEAGWRDWADSRTIRIPKALQKGEEDADLDFQSRDFNSSAADTINRLLARLAIEDPALGVQCFEKTGAQARGPFLIPFAAVWYDREPEAAMRWLATLPFNEYQEPDNLLSNIGLLAPEDMRHWALRLPPGPLTAILAQNYVKGTLFPDPESALREIPFTDPASRQAAEAGILDQWAAAAPAQALDHFLKTANPKPELCQSIVRNWTRYDASAASAWVTALEPGAVRDAAITGLVVSLSDAYQLPDPAVALAWSLEIGDPAKRLTATRQVMETWEGNSAETEAARQALSDAPDLSEDDRGFLLQLLPSAPP